MQEFEGERGRERRARDDCASDLAESIKQLEQCLGELDASRREIKRMRASIEEREAARDAALGDKQRLAEELDVLRQRQEQGLQEHNKVAGEIQHIENAVAKLLSAWSSVAAPCLARVRPLAATCSAPAPGATTSGNPGAGEERGVDAVEVVGDGSPHGKSSASPAPGLGDASWRMDGRPASDGCIRSRSPDATAEREGERRERERLEVLQLRDALRRTQDRLEEALEHCHQDLQVMMMSATASR